MIRPRRLLLASLLAAWVVMVLACGGVDHAHRPSKDDTPPDVTLAIDYKGFDDKMGGQDFDLRVENKSDRSATFYAVVYESNDSVNPPLRDLDPCGMTWMDLCGKRSKGDLTPQDIEQHWSDTPTRPRNWHDGKAFRFDLKAKEKMTEDTGWAMSYKTSPLGAWKGQRLAPVGCSRFRAWLFTENGKFFHEETIDVDPTPKK